MDVSSGKPSEIHNYLIKYFMGIYKGGRNTEDFRKLLKNCSIVGNFGGIGMGCSCKDVGIIVLDLLGFLIRS